ncbi:probable WRKY transcription factor protein 1 [Aphidius gifuensis]|uniref:probable WRKY transcription factor protein 1 n=1 Tax=Aphidius gifuensis TaxID=684658 RepID=UPI001CDBCD14|nr:probable WRKY transcription factor protein 1 [Aphidius gifuensis]
MSNVEDTYMNGMEDFDIDEHNEYLLIAKSEPPNNDEEEEEGDTIYHEAMMTEKETQNNFTISKHELYYDENESTEFNEMDLLNNSSSNYLDDNKIEFFKQETNDIDYMIDESNNSSLDNDEDDNNGNNNDDDDDDASDSDEKADEETMATFYTSDGQRLALYALENSEDIFAVSVYDESAPPNDFQFLAKSDVERLISEGAIETVKKPSQLKKKSFHVGETPPIPKRTTTTTTTINNPPIINKLPSAKNTYANVNVSKKINSPLNVNPTRTTYQNMNKPRRQTILSSNVKIIKHYSKPSDKINPREIVQKSTVQHILQDNQEEDEELTLDDIAHLFTKEKIQNKNGINKIIGNNKSNTAVTSTKTPEKPHITRRIPQILSNTASKYSSNNNSNNNNHSSTPIKRKNSPEIRNNFLGKGVSPPPPPDDINMSGLNSPKSSTDELTNFSRMKRSRKQQLTFVDRADSEIIIQPLAEQEEEEKEEEKKRTGNKRGRKKRDLPKKKKPAILKGTKKRRYFSKKYATRRIEIIDVDTDVIDDESSGKKKKNKIDEITIYDGKEKGSSDKENDIIEVGDTDEDNREAQEQVEEDEINEEDEDNAEEIEKNKKNKFECHDCHRIFYTKSALKNNNNKTRVNSLRSSRLNKNNNDVSNDNEKKYTCKTCGDKFDVVVALARHVRCTHSLQKKKMNNDTTNEDPEYSIPPHTLKSHEINEKTNLFNKNTRTRRKKKLFNAEPSIVVKRKIDRALVRTSWKSKSMDCRDCGKWFPSIALLLTHSLKHVTKKTAQFLYKIKIQKSTQHRKQSTNKETSIKKRTRPKKI